MQIQICQSGRLAWVVLVQYFNDAGVNAAQVYAAVGPCDAEVSVSLNLFPFGLQFVGVLKLVKHSVKGFFVKHIFSLSPPNFSKQDT